MSLLNVWPELKAEAKLKDRVEDALRRSVCVDDTLTVQQAQAAIARDWTREAAVLPTP